MNDNDIIQTLGTRLEEMGTPLFVLWEDKDLPVGQQRPYLRFELNPRTSAPKISGGLTHSGFAQVMVVCEIDKFGTEANRVAAEVADLFEYELRLPCAGGWLQITEHTIAGPAFRSGDDWLKPVQIDYIAM